MLNLAAEAADRARIGQGATKMCIYLRKMQICRQYANNGESKIILHTWAAIVKKKKRIAGLLILGFGDSGTHQELRPVF
jgi:hypothetical protein